MGLKLSPCCAPALANLAWQQSDLDSLSPIFLQRYQQEMFSCNSTNVLIPCSSPSRIGTFEYVLTRVDCRELLYHAIVVCSAGPARTGRVEPCLLPMCPALSQPCYKIVFVHNRVVVLDCCEDDLSLDPYTPEHCHIYYIVHVWFSIVTRIRPLMCRGRANSSFLVLNPCRLLGNFLFPCCQLELYLLPWGGETLYPCTLCTTVVIR